MLIEILATGPPDGWLKTKTKGLFWRLLWYRTEPPVPQTTYRVDILDEAGTTLLYSEETVCSNEDYALGWADATFMWFLMANGYLPPPGYFRDSEDARRTSEKLERYRRK